MTNAEIIKAAQAYYGIDEEVHTFAEWKKKGHAVRKGEHAAFKVKIWLFTKELVEVEDGVVQEQERFVMKPAAFFGKSQVEAIR